MTPRETREYGLIRLSGIRSSVKTIKRPIGKRLILEKLELALGRISSGGDTLRKDPSLLRRLIT